MLRAMPTSALRSTPDRILRRKGSRACDPVQDPEPIVAIPTERRLPTQLGDFLTSCWMTAMEHRLASLTAVSRVGFGAKPEAAKFQMSVRLASKAVLISFW